MVLVRDKKTGIWYPKDKEIKEEPLPKGCIVPPAPADDIGLRPADDPEYTSKLNEPIKEFVPKSRTKKKGGGRKYKGVFKVLDRGQVVVTNRLIRKLAHNKVVVSLPLNLFGDPKDHNINVGDEVNITLKKITEP